MTRKFQIVDDTQRLDDQVVVHIHGGRFTIQVEIAKTAGMWSTPRVSFPGGIVNMNEIHLWNAMIDMASSQCHRLETFALTGYLDNPDDTSDKPTE